MVQTVLTEIAAQEYREQRPSFFSSIWVCKRSFRRGTEKKCSWEETPWAEDGLQFTWSRGAKGPADPCFFVGGLLVSSISSILMKITGQIPFDYFVLQAVCWFCFSLICFSQKIPCWFLNIAHNSQHFLTMACQSVVSRPDRSSK